MIEDDQFYLEVGDQSLLILQMEYCSSSILKRVKENYEFSEREIKRMMREVLTGLDFLHKNGLVHLDIKPGNQIH